MDILILTFTWKLSVLMTLSMLGLDDSLVHKSTQSPYMEREKSLVLLSALGNFLGVFVPSGNGRVDAVDFKTSISKKQ